MASVSRQSVSLPKLLFGLLVLAGSAWAQGLASLRGTVMDSSGGVIPSATITVTQVGTGFSRTVSTDTQGDYLIPALHPADYVMTAQAKGFRQTTREGITLLADQSVTVNVRMEVGDATQTVTVEAAITHVDTTTGTQSQVINQTQMVELPLNGRNAAELSLAGGRGITITRGRRRFPAGCEQTVPQSDRRFYQWCTRRPDKLHAGWRHVHGRVLFRQPALPSA